MNKLLKTCLVLMTTISAAHAGDFQTIKGRIFKDYLVKGDAASISDWKMQDIQNWMKAQSKVGSWPDLDYSSASYNDVSFKVIQHVARMEGLSQAYATPGHKLYKNKDVLAAIWKAYDFWVSQNVESYNWWNNEIGVPLRIQKTMVLLEDQLTPQRKAAGIKILEKARISKTGQNLLWFAEIVLTKSLLLEDLGQAKKAIDAIQAEVSVSSDEGIRQDNSFHQHGNLIFSGGYGAKFSFNIARFINFTQGTAAQFNPMKYNIISNYILDGQRWVSRANKWDYGVVGREIVRKGMTANLLGETCELMGSVPSPRKAEFLDCAESEKNNKVSKLSGNKHFWVSDMMAHQRKDFYSSVRMYSKRTFNNDAPSNSEGLLSHHLADGANLLMKDGSEYQDIFPVWDWRKIPGTTVEQKTLKPAVYVPGNWDGFAHIRYEGWSTFVGGVSDGNSGIAAMDFVSNKTFEKVDAKKSWFFFDEGYIALGTDIKSTGSAPVVTTLDQSLLKTGVRVIDDQNVAGDLNQDQENHSDLKAILHNGVAYVFPSAQPLTVSKKTQMGDWFRISEQYDRSPVQREVFSAWINHGANSPTAKYEYLVLPNTTEAQVLGYNYKANFQVTNLASVQSVYQTSTGVYQAVFYKAGKHSVAGLEVEVDRPCLVMIKKVGGKLVAFVSDPTQNLSTLSLRVNSKTVTVSLPQGAMNGKTVEVKL